MIEKKQIYVAVCDRCGKECQTDYPAPTASEAQALAEVDGWLSVGDRMYCPDCYEQDRETGEWVEKRW